MLVKKGKRPFTASLCRPFLIATTFLASSVFPNPLLGTVVYSGIQNLTLQGTGNGTQASTIVIAGDPVGTWDQLRLSVFPQGPGGSAASNDVIGGSWDVILASYWGANANGAPYPFVKRLRYGDPSPEFPFTGSGSSLLWIYDPGRLSGVFDAGEFTDGSGYAAMKLSGGYLGWIQLRVSGYRSSTPTLTIVDWAYSNVIGEIISMGQGGPVPDMVPPTTSAALLPGPNRYGWNNSSVKADLSAADNPGGSGVRDIQLALGGAQNTGWKTVSGDAAAVTISAEGTTVLTYLATDNAGNCENTKTLTVKADQTPPVISGMPPRCIIWPSDHKLVKVATLTANDRVSGLLPGSFTVHGHSSDSYNDGIVIAGGPDQFDVLVEARKGKVYILTAKAADRAGNIARLIAACTVPHDQEH
jgi:hypothetical protein